MTLTEAIQVRQDQLCGKPVHDAVLAEAISVIAGSITKRRNRAYGTTPKQRLATDNQQVRLLKDALKGSA